MIVPVGKRSSLDLHYIEYLNGSLKRDSSNFELNRPSKRLDGSDEGQLRAIFNVTSGIRTTSLIFKEDSKRRGSRRNSIVARGP